MVIGGPDIKGEDAFHQALGDVLSSWQLVEGSAYGLFVSMMAGADQKLVSVAFHHIQSFDLRITLLDRCAYFALPNDSLRERWKALHKRLIANTENRNRIVHFAASYTHSPQFNGYSLGPSHMNALYAIKDKWKNPDLKFDRERLQRMSYDFEQLGRDLGQFNDDFAAIAKKTSRTKRSRSTSPKSSK